ncbi:MAG: hypothetical protein K0R77_122 [Chryseobacterium sp.]|jgi:hypothetical protein|uniref:hypothetical protein n=1 Tax=Chryseobacterium sp. TaxID=1871047 RepID=UPI002605D270|nr:hypothetical protein [Chryseobacterium sp.]MDF2550847.1 hypothetical protein [Chryseobacterium sp.]
MKNIIRIIILFIGFGVNAQSYTFDYNLKIRCVNPKGATKITTGQFILNSDTPTYEMYIRQDNGGVLIDKIDNEKYILHDFLHSKISNKSFYNFTSIREINNNLEKRSIDHVDVEKIGENKYFIKCYPTKKSKSTNLEIIVNLRPTDRDLLRFYYLDLGYSIRQKLIASLKEKLHGNYNYFIESFSTNYRNGYKTESYIDGIEKIDLKIITPQ